MESWIDNMTAEEFDRYERWLDELECKYMDESYIEEKAAEEDERNFNYFGEF